MIPERPKKSTHLMYRGKRARPFPIPLEKGASGLRLPLAARTFYEICSPLYEKGEVHGQQPSEHVLQPSSTGS